MQGLMRVTGTAYATRVRLVWHLGQNVIVNGLGVLNVAVLLMRSALPHEPAHFVRARHEQPQRQRKKLAHFLAITRLQRMTPHSVRRTITHICEDKPPHRKGA